MNPDNEFLRRELNRELAAISARLVQARNLETRAVLNGGFELERWLSRALALGGIWQKKASARVRILGEEVRLGGSLENGLERLIRLLMEASENLNRTVEIRKMEEPAWKA
ncbi:MAG: hypothetical protein ACREL1_06780 [bacterium]